MPKLNCWELKKCGREPGGSNIAEFGICPAALEDRTDGINEGLHAGRACWAVAGTFCGGKIQGNTALKIENCTKCDFYQLVMKEQGLDFHSTKDIITKMTMSLFSIGLPLLLKTAEYNNIGTHLVGWEAKKCLIAKYPYVNGEPIFINNGDSYTIKFIKDDDAYVFDTEVISFQHHPASLVFFKYPQNVRKMPFRKFKRFKVHIPAHMQYAEENLTIDALITDISENGCRLKIMLADGNKAKDLTSCRIRFTILNEELKDIDCTVKNIQQDESVQYAGIEFNHLSPENSGIIKSFIDLLKDGSG